MTKPTYEELLGGSTVWSKVHRGITYNLSFHGFRAQADDTLFGEGHKCTWCYYIFVPEQMFPHRWGDFQVDVEGGYPDCFDDYGFYGGVTWASNEPFYDRKTGKTWGVSKVGCDYNHSWDRDMGYPDTYWSVNEDAKRTVEVFLERNPDGYKKCRWSGVWDKAENFYECVGGWLVHRDSEVPDNYDKWKAKL